MQLLGRLHWPVLLAKLPLALLYSCMTSIVQCQNECTQYKSYLRCCMRDGRQYQPQANQQSRCICKEDKPVLDQRTIDDLAASQAQNASIRYGVQFLSQRV